LALHFVRCGAAKSDTLAGIADMPPARGGSGPRAYDLTGPQFRRRVASVGTATLPCNRFRLNATYAATRLPMFKSAHQQVGHELSVPLR